MQRASACSRSVWYPSPPWSQSRQAYLLVGSSFLGLSRAWVRRILHLSNMIGNLLQHSDQEQRRIDISEKCWEATSYRGYQWTELTVVQAYSFGPERSHSRSQMEGGASESPALSHKSTLFRSRHSFLQLWVWNDARIDLMYRDAESICIICGWMLCEIDIMRNIISVTDSN